MKFIKKNKKYIIIFAIGLLLILTGLVSWTVFFSRYQDFKNQEIKFLEAGKRYYQYNKSLLPNQDETREVNLGKLYSSNRIDSLVIPKTNKLCDSENSWVRVYNDHGNFVYTVYLKCGRYQTKIDHTKPEITLNGGSEIFLSLGSTYQELGVEKVVDNKDKNIDISQVKIDSSSINTNKIGNYKVTYTVRDSSYNKAVVTRKVRVLRNLTEVVQNSTDASNYYKGGNVNNFILISGMLFRIINVNPDGTVKVMSYDSIANIPYGKEGISYQDSNIRHWLNNKFYKALTNPDHYIAEGTWCMDEVTDDSQIISNCTNTIKDKVGLLTISDWNQSKSNGTTYLSSINEFWLMTKTTDSTAYIHSLTNNGIDKFAINNLTGVKPVFNLKANLYITEGNGTVGNPYQIGDYKFAEAGDYLHTRIIGEYVSYSGMLFRIAGFDKEKNIKLISIGYLNNNTTDVYLYAKYDNQDKVMLFDPSEEKNIGQKLNDEYIDFIDSSKIVEHKYSIYEFNDEVIYSKYKKKKTIKAKLSIPSSFDLFSGVSSSYVTIVNYWLLDFVDAENAFMINSSNGRTFTVCEGFYDACGFKLVIYINKDTKIKEGKGIINSPYSIK